MTRRVIDIQTDFAHINGYKSEIFWDLLSANQHEILEEKIKNLIPDQEASNNNTNNNYKTVELRSKLFEKIWSQRKYTNGNSLSSIIYVLVTKASTRYDALNSPKYSCHPVFRTRKCVAEDNSTKCCMIFIDETGRVYKNWSDYVNENVLPKGLMVAPSNGYYTFNDDNMVNLLVCETPASNAITEVFETADKAAAATGFVSAGIGIAAVFSAPIAAPILALATGAGLVSATYSALRSGANLADRSSHGESIGLEDRQARASWLGVAGGVVGLGAAKATKSLAAAATAGKEVSLMRSILVNGMNISSIVLSGSGVANGALELILKSNDGEDITAMDCLQLAASLVLFTHSINNFKLASNIVADARNSKINSYRKTLSNRQRRMFDKMTKETIRIKGPNQGKIDVIRSVNEIPNKQYLNDLFKVNRELNKQKVRPSFGGAEKPIMLNNDLPVDTKLLRNSVQHSKGPDVLGQVKQPIPSTHPDGGKVDLNNTSSNIQTTNSSTAKEQITVKDRLKALKDLCLKTACGGNITLAQVGEFLLKCVNNPDSMTATVTIIAKKYAEAIVREIFEVARHFIENWLDYFETRIGVKIPGELVLKRIENILKAYVNITVEFIKKITLEIISRVKKFFESEEAREWIEACNRNDADVCFIYANSDEASGDYVEALKNAKVQLASHDGVALKDYDNEFFEHILNFNSFKDVIMSMAQKFPLDIFRFMLDLTNKFILDEMDSIQRLLRIPLATEDILYRILKHCFSVYQNFDYNFLLERSSDILKAVVGEYLKLNPNYNPNLRKCPDCPGYYSICNI